MDTEEIVKNKSELPLEGLKSILDATKGEYQYLQEARNNLHTRVGILVALLTALVSAAFIKETPGFIELFKKNILIAHFRVVCLVILFISFILALTSYIRVFFARDYYVFSYDIYTSGSKEQISEFSNEDLIMSIYKQYAKCIDYNQKVFDKTIMLYKKGNKWLIVTMIFAIISLIISLI